MSKTLEYHDGVRWVSVAALIDDFYRVVLGEDGVGDTTVNFVYVSSDWNYLTAVVSEWMPVPQGFMEMIR